MALNALGAWFRSRCLGLPFGDQGLALPRALFERLGGFDESLRGGEDHDLVWRARRAGVPLQPARAPLYTSARKYAQRGWGATTAFHLRETWRQARRFSRGGGDP
ncbi:MAG TPA: glycosyl transferase family 2, partial [Pseudoxanthomonas sp.]|nr:glycosyl transferase family 2 [Pseudoxanthomonas sp.]